MLNFYDSELTPRENEIVKIFAEKGYKKDENLAEILNISVNTVNKHIDNIKYKKDLASKYHVYEHYKDLLKNDIIRK